MYKTGKWAAQILAQQKPDGSWGSFHSLAQPTAAPLTTEQALRRLERLGFTIEDACIQQAIAYLHACLVGETCIPDPREQVHDWDLFTALMFSAWIRRFTDDDPAANHVAAQWAEVITRAFASGSYDHAAYAAAFHDILKPKGGNLIGFQTFYPVSLLRDCLDTPTERAFVDHILHSDNGVYYICDSRLDVLPDVFESRAASRYLAAIELLAKYPHARESLVFVVQWLNDHRNERGGWDMGKSVSDKVYFPLSDSWRKDSDREADCTARITRLLQELTA